MGGFFFFCHNAHHSSEFERYDGKFNSWRITNPPLYGRISSFQKHNAHHSSELERYDGKFNLWRINKSSPIWEENFQIFQILTPTTTSSELSVMTENF